MSNALDFLGNFCDDPLVAIIGQLFLYRNKNQGNSKTSAYVKKSYGIKIPELLKNLRDSSLDEYAEQIKNKNELKKNLKKLSDKVKKETGHPLIFIIDELDRCRPTFAIELLERIKHIFDIPNMIFVFGVNRSELYSALQSIYGKIDASVYFRRFFDMEFSLPETYSEPFCKSLINKYKLKKFFSELSKNPNNDLHDDDFKAIFEFFPFFCRQMGLSLRDIDYCVRSIVFVAKNIKEEHYIYPHLISVLIVLRLKNPDLYLDFMYDKCFSSKVADYIDEEISIIRGESYVSKCLDYVEYQLYYIHESRLAPEEKDSSPVEQLRLLCNGQSLTRPEYLSEMTKKSDKARNLQVLSMDRSTYSYRRIKDIFNLIELASRTVQE